MTRERDSALKSLRLWPQWSWIWKTWSPSCPHPSPDIIMQWSVQSSRGFRCRQQMRERSCLEFTEWMLGVLWLFRVLAS